MGKKTVKKNKENQQTFDNPQKEEKNQQEPVNAGQSKEDKDSPKNRKNQLYWIVGSLLFLIAVYFISSYFFSKANALEYEGLTFTKEKFGEIPVFHYYYYITPDLKYNLYLRNDPRKNTVSITGRAAGNSNIEFFKNEDIYLSVNPEGLAQCEYGRVGISTLASFLADNQFKVKGATTDRQLANETNIEYATCSSNPRDPVIILQAADKTEIIQNSRNCHIINIANCEILDAVEKFEVQSILDAKARREAKN